MKRALAMALLLFLSATASAGVFDGKRKGFVVGVGFGGAPYTHWSTQVQGIDFGEDLFGLGYNLLVGYGVDEHNILAAEANLVSFHSDMYDVGLIGGFGGCSWYHYFGPQGKSFFSAAGLGVYRLVDQFGTIYINFSFGNGPVEPPLPTEATGPGYLLGCGYEFTKYIQAAIYLSGGRPSQWGLGYGSTQVNVMVTTVVY